MNGRFWPCRN